MKLILFFLNSVWELVAPHTYFQNKIMRREADQIVRKITKEFPILIKARKRKIAISLVKRFHEEGEIVFLPKGASPEYYVRQFLKRNKDELINTYCWFLAKEGASLHASAVVGYESAMRILNR